MKPLLALLLSILACSIANAQGGPPPGVPSWPDPFYFSHGNTDHRAVPHGFPLPPMGPGATHRIDPLPLYDQNTSQHTLSAVVTFYGHTSGPTPTVGNITSPIGTVTQVIRQNFGAYGLPSYSFGVSASGYPTGTPIPLGSIISVGRFKHTGYMLYVDAKVRVIIQTQGGATPIEITVNGVNSFSTPQLDATHNYMVTGYPGST